MNFNVIEMVTGLFKPAAELIDNVHTSTEEKQIQRNILVQLQNSVTEKLLEFQTKLLQAQTSIITAEASGQSWIQRNWRPITMFSFLLLVLCDSFGLLPNPLAPEAWVLLQIGLGGYVAGRSGEKIMNAKVGKQ
tara:strand:- start:176473 stop:176874 length:402 start_codon:yes stop_codon:yes gene_type:complete